MNSSLIMKPACPPLLTVFCDGGSPACTRGIGFQQRRCGAERIDWVNLAHCEDSEPGTDLKRVQA